MRALLVASALFALAVSGLKAGVPTASPSGTANPSSTPTPAPKNRHEPQFQWDYNFFGGGFEPLAIKAIDLAFVPVNFNDQGSAIFAINLLSGVTAWTLELDSYHNRAEVPGPGHYSYDASSNQLFLTNSTAFIAVNASSGHVVWATSIFPNLTPGSQGLGYGQVTVGNNGFIYYSGQYYQNLTVLNATTGDVVYNDIIITPKGYTCNGDYSASLGPRPVLGSSASSPIVGLVVSCGECIFAGFNVAKANMMAPNQTWGDVLSKCTKGEHGIAHRNALAYQYSGPFVTAVAVANGNQEWSYTFTDGQVIRAPAIDDNENIYVGRVLSTASNVLLISKLSGTRQDIVWTTNYTVDSQSGDFINDYHTWYNGSDLIYVTYSVQNNQTNEGSSSVCGLDASSGSKMWCVPALNATKGIVTITRPDISEGWMVVSTEVSQVGSSVKAGTLSAFALPVTPVTQAPGSGIVIQNCSASTDCGGSCTTQYPTTGCNAGYEPGTSVLYFCEGGNTLLYAQYFNSSSTCNGLPTSAKQYGVGICYPDGSDASLRVTHC